MYRNGLSLSRSSDSNFEPFLRKVDGIFVGDDLHDYSNKSRSLLILY